MTIYEKLDTWLTIEIPDKCFGRKKKSLHFLQFWLFSGSNIEMIKKKLLFNKITYFNVCVVFSILKKKFKHDITVQTCVSYK